MCPSCGTPCQTGSEQIRWGEKTGSWANQREIVGNRDIVGNFREIVGAEGDSVTPGTAQLPPGHPPAAATPAFHPGTSMFQMAWQVVGLLSTPALMYHGYVRNDDSVMGALGWGLLSIVWPVTLPIAVFHQGFGKPSEETKFKQAARARGV